MNNYKDKIWPIAKVVIYVLTVLATAGLMIKVAGLNMLPTKYLAPIILAVVFILLVIYLLFFGVPKIILDKLSKKHTWSVVESEVPEGFKVSYKASENTVTVINTATDVLTTEPTTAPEELADTGQLNWPVPVLSVFGLLEFQLPNLLNFGFRIS